MKILLLILVLLSSPSWARQSASTQMDIEATVYYTDKAVEVYYCACMNVVGAYCSVFSKAWYTGAYIGTPRIPEGVFTAAAKDVDALCQDPFIQDRMKMLAQ